MQEIITGNEASQAAVKNPEKVIPDLNVQSWTFVEKYK